MKRHLTTALISLALITSAEAQVSKTVMTAAIAACFPDNTTGAITPAGIRTCLGSLINSYQQYAGVNAQLGTTYTVQASDYGQLVTFNNVGAVAVTLPQPTSSFVTYNFTASNLGAGNVTITPTGSTINGAATFVLATNQSVWIVSDGANWQTARGTGSVPNPLTVAIGGTGSNLSATGGASQVVKQTSVGGAFTVAQLAASDLSNGVTGSGAAVLANTPTLITPVLGVATATSINKMAITPPASSSTLAVADGKVATISNTLTFTGTDTSSAAFGTGGTVAYTIASGAKALATGTINSAACTAAQTDTATGTATTDAIVVSFNADPTAVTGYVPLTSGMLSIIYYPTLNTVNFKVCNNTAGSITPGAITINWRVVR